MAKHFRIIYQSYDNSNPEAPKNESILLEEEIHLPTNCLDFSLGLDKQLGLVKAIQDRVLSEKLELVGDEACECPHCKIQLGSFGKQSSLFHDIFTDHELKMQRRKCKKCGYEIPSTVKSLLGDSESGELKKIQAALGAKHTYRACEQILELFSGDRRRVNNHDRVKKVTESVGQSMTKLLSEEKDLLVANPAKELIVNIDGGHIATTRPDKRSMEAITSVIYRPEALKVDRSGNNYISNKNCAAAIDSDGEHIIPATIIAALKQGLSEETHITVICDGAKNCWKVAKSLKPMAKNTTLILDWFHIGMRIQNISLPPLQKDKLLRIKWHLWRGNVKNALVRLKQLIEQVDKNKGLLEKLFKYISNNKDKIVDYRKRKMDGLVFTSSLAESTVESLINRRCKGHQHMRWSQDGLNPILQLRAVIGSNKEWNTKWRSAVLNAA